MNTHNWAGNFAYSAKTIEEPDSIERVQGVVRRAHAARALGTRHSFNEIADSSDVLIAMTKLDHVLGHDAERRTVTIEGGVRYGQLGAYLQREGLALQNLASLPHISVAGACATATHGSGERNGNLATAVSAMELVTATGDIVAVSRASHGDQFNGMVVSLGSLGIVVTLTLDVVPTFDVRQDVYENLPLEELAAHFDEIQASGYSVSLFTDWTNKRFTQVWVKRLATANDPPTSFFGAARAESDRHPIPSSSGEHCTPQMGARGPLHERLPHFRMDFTPSNGEELQSEYYVPREHGVAALGAMMRLGDRIAPQLLVSEVRTIAADRLWMSPCYAQDCVAIHFTWKRDWVAVEPLVREIEAVLAPYAARPHWGKLFTMDARGLRAVFPRLPDFQELMRSWDPLGKFRNSFIDAYIYGSSSR